ncbi:unnamed protein product [Alopecurus aequalis]
MASVSGSMSVTLAQVRNSRPLSFMPMVQRGTLQLPEKLYSWGLIHQTTTATAMAVHGNAGEITDIHSRNSSKTLLKESLYEYMLKTIVYPRENEYLRELRLITREHTYGHMRSTPDEALLLSLLVKMMGAKNTIEIGVFTGCSVLATALAVPEDGQVVAIDVSRDYFSLGLPVIEKAGVAHKIDFREGPAGPILDKLLSDEGNMGRFDFAFVDADKSNYGSYHDKLLSLVRVGGVLAYDNTLWGGTVAMPDDTPLREEDREIRDSMMAFNAKIAAETRVDAVQLPVADGITLCRRRL